MIRALTLLILTAIVMASVACSNRPTQVEPTLNIDALVEANKVIDALVEAKVKEVVAALPTSTPYPTYTLVPTPNPIPTPTVILPTPTVILPTPTMPPTMTPVPLSMATRTSVPPPTVTPLPTVITEGTLPVLPWTTTTPEPNGSSLDPNAGPNINDEWINNLESLIHAAINRERRKNNLPDVQYDSVLSDIARLHSQDMIESGYYEHVNKKGETPEDRAKKVGYVCQNKRIGDWVYTGLAEEILTFRLWKDLSLEDGDLIYDYYSPSEIAYEIVSGEEKGWTAGDRETIILQDPDIHRTQGVGVAVQEGTFKLGYVTLNMSACDFRWRSQK